MKGSSPSREIFKVPQAYQIVQCFDVGLFKSGLTFLEEAAYTRKAMQASLDRLCHADASPNHVSHSLNSLKRSCIGDYIGNYYRGD